MQKQGDSPGPYKWLVLLGCFGLQLTGSGITLCVGVFYVIFKENLGGTSTSLSLATSLNMGFFFGIGPVAGLLTDRLGCRPVAMLGSFLGTLGLVTTALTTEVWQLNLTFGLLTGVGSGLTYIPSIAAVPQYFSKNRSLAIGIAASGLGTGPIIFPPLIQLFLHEFGWRGALLMVAGLYAHTVVFACLLRPNPDNISDAKVDSDKAITEKSEKRGFMDKCISKDFCDSFLLKDLYFDLFMIHNTLFALGISIIFVHMGAYAVTKGYSEDQAAMLFFMHGIASATLRPITGFIAQSKCLGACKLYFITLNLCSACTILFPLGLNYVMLGAGATLNGAFYASFGALPPLITVQLVGVQRLAVAYGYVCIFGAIGFVTGGPFAGLIYDSTKHYPTSFYSAGGIMVLSTLFLIPIFARKPPRSSTTETKVHSNMEVEEKNIGAKQTL